MPKRKPEQPKRDRPVDELIETSRRLQERGRKLMDQLEKLTSEITEARAKAQDNRSEAEVGGGRYPVTSSIAASRSVKLTGLARCLS
jgi:hypothetical protein